MHILKFEPGTCLATFGSRNIRSTVIPNNDACEPGKPRSRSSALSSSEQSAGLRRDRETLAASADFEILAIDAR